MSNLLQIDQIRIRITGTRPLLLCRGEAANPFDPQARDIKRISQKRRKSDEDHELLTRLQFESACYYDPKIGPYLPTENFWKCMQEGAAKFRESPLVKTQVLVKGFVGKEIDIAAAAIAYDGPRTIEELYEDKRFVFLKMGRLPSSKARILIARPRFDQWSAEFLIEYTEIEKQRLIDYCNVAGRLIGVGTWRPQHGLFSVEVLK